MIIAAHKMDLPEAKENLKKLKAEFPSYRIIPVSADSELALKEAAKHEIISYLSGDGDFKIISEAKLNEKQRKALEYIRENVLKQFGSTGVQRVLNEAVFEMLKYIAIWPGGLTKLADKEGRILPDVFLLPPGSTALDFAFKIHTDIAKGFVCAINVRTKQRIGKETLLKHRDVIEIIAKK
jgi:ribosome-binding ATPase YchF (GTP1/OBG family)